MSHLVLRVVSTLLAASLAASAAAKVFRSADVHPDDYPTVLAVKWMSDEIARRTGGKHSIKVFTGTRLGDEKETIEQARVGALDLVRINVAPMNGICPATMVPTMPFLFRSKAHMRHVLDGPIGEQILSACEPQGFIGLAFYDAGSRSLYTVSKPVRKPEDARGLNVRVQLSDLWVAMVEAMGARATPMPYGAVYTALKNGLVDAAENNWPSYDTSKHHEVAKFYSLNEHSMAPEMLLMSKRVWDTLDAEDQRLFREVARASVAYMRKLWDAKEAASRKRVEAAGARVIEVDKKAFSDAMSPVYDRFITDPKLKEMVRSIQSLNASPVPPAAAK